MDGETLDLAKQFRLSASVFGSLHPLLLLAHELLYVYRVGDEGSDDCACCCVGRLAGCGRICTAALETRRAHSLETVTSGFSARAYNQRALQSALCSELLIPVY